MNTKPDFRRFSPVKMNRDRAIDDVFESELLSLAFTSDVNDPDPAQFKRAQEAMHRRAVLIEKGHNPADISNEDDNGFLKLCEEILREHLEARRKYFDPEQCVPLDDAEDMAKEGRDTFLIIKFMDEEPHIRATLDSLLYQKGVDHSRLVIVAADNKSRDRSGEIVKEVIENNKTDIRIFYVEQDISGGGSTARYGVDRCLATILKMCESDGDWARLQRARIAVSDGDTVYHSGLVADSVGILDDSPHIDGVMPFLIYKITACHRFFNNYIPRNPVELLELWEKSGKPATEFSGEISTADDLDRFPRKQRTIANLNGNEGMRLEYQSTQSASHELFVPFVSSLTEGLRFGVISDSNDVRTYVFEDGTMTIETACVSGSETALTYLENGLLKEDEKWKWHTLVGHDLFLTWAFQKMGLNESLVLPDTSDALKMFRAWSFAVGGQHQLSRPDMHRVTGTDYQSGRVLQSFGAQTVLGSSNAYSETEVDRLAKMVRNFANEQSVFYGNTRSRGLERASGLYLHMTSIQDQVEAEVRNYSDYFYEQVAFPERIIFPLRWMLQNFIGFYSRADAAGKKSIVDSSFSVIFNGQVWEKISETILTTQNINDLSLLSFEAFRERSEELAEDIMQEYWSELLSFYKSTLVDYFGSHDLSDEHFGWLLEGLENCRNGMLDDRPIIDPNQVWSPDSFVIDYQRGQVLNIQEPVL